MAACLLPHMLPCFEDVPLVEFMYLVFSSMPGESYRRRLMYGLCCDCVTSFATKTTIYHAGFLLSFRFSYYLLSSLFRAQELCESRGGRPGLPSLINLRFLWTQSNTSANILLFGDRAQGFHARTNRSDRHRTALLHWGGCAPI